MCGARGAHVMFTRKGRAKEVLRSPPHKFLYTMLTRHLTFTGNFTGKIRLYRYGESSEGR